MAKVRKVQRREETFSYWLMVLPAVVIYLFVMAFPSVISVMLSLSDFKGGVFFGKEGINIHLTGIAQYIGLMKDPYFWFALKNNIYIVLISVFGQIPLGFILAYICFRKLVKFPAFWQGILYVPVIISTIVLGIMWQTVFSPVGPITEVMNNMYKTQFHEKLVAAVQSMGGFNITDDLVNKVLSIARPDMVAQFSSNPVEDLKAVMATYTSADYNTFLNDMTNLFAQKWSTDFLAKPDISMLPILFVILWQWSGFYLILFLANMQKIDTSILEAAQIDGASEMQILRHIIFPALSGAVVTMIILAISGSLQQFNLIWAMTGGGPANITNTLAIYMYRRAFQQAPDYPLANTISTVMIIISFLLIIVVRLLESRFGVKESEE